MPFFIFSKTFGALCAEFLFAILSSIRLGQRLSTNDHRLTYSALHTTDFKSTPSFAISYRGESSRSRLTVSTTRSPM